MAEGDRKTESRIPISGPDRPRLSLLVMSEQGVFTHALPDRGTVTIGRAARCEVLVSDALLSREHARLRIGDIVEIEDLGSSNGTRVGSRQLAANEAATLALGDVVSIGSTVLVLQPATANQRPRQLWSHGYFESRLEEECARAAQARTTFAVLRVRFDLDAEPTALESRLSACLGPERVVGSYAPSEYEVLLTDVSPELAEREAKKLMAQLANEGALSDVGVACYPRDGRTPEALVACAGRRRAGSARDAVAPDIPASGALARLSPIVERFAVGTIPVLVLGETGVGKDVLATMIHRLSPRSTRPYVCLNCAALPEQLLESELFGYERGAFTGATAAKAGLLESANGGTVFLDEVAEMPLAAQAKLLRVLDQGEVLRLGATRPRSIDVRFVAATNRDLVLEVERGRFREDLYFRLAAAAIVVPPLRERVAEIAPLAVTFVAEACRELGRTRAPQILPAAMALLERHSWPGNIRELRNAMERAVLLSGDGDIGIDQLAHEQMGRKLRGDSRAETLPSMARVSAPPLHVQARVQNAGDTLTRDPEAVRLMAVLDACDWNQTKAATELGISRRTLVSRLTAYGLTRRRGRD